MLTSVSRTISSPIGTLRVTATERGMTGVALAEDADAANAQEAPAFLQECLQQLDEYFAGQRTVFTGLSLALQGTEFALDVWNAAAEIPWGQTMTYAALAERVGSPGGQQAVGQALNRNPLLLLIPCHRIVPASFRGQSLMDDRAQDAVGGFACGSEAKLWLLRHEAS